MRTSGKAAPGPNRGAVGYSGCWEKEERRRAGVWPRKRRIGPGTIAAEDLNASNDASQFGSIVDFLSRA